MNANTEAGVIVQPCAAVRNGLDAHGRTHNNTPLFSLLTHFARVCVCVYLAEKCWLSSPPSAFAESSEVVYVTHCSVL